MQIKSFMTLAILSGLLVFFSCTDSLNSAPNFIFKSAPKPGIVAKMGDVEVTEEELYRDLRSEIYDQEVKIYELKMNKLKALVLEKLIKNHPKGSKLTNDQFMDQVIVRNKDVSDKDIEKFVKERKIPKEHMNPQMKERIKQYLHVEIKKNAIEDWLGRQTKKNPVEVYLTKPRRPIFNINVEGAPFAGGENAKVTIVEYTDFECPFCSKGADTMAALKKKYGKKIKVVFKNFPLPFHNNAKNASMAAHCAGDEGMKFFWKMHDKLFKTQAQLDLEGVKVSAKAIGLKDLDKFAKCMESKKYEDLIEKDIKEGKEIGIKSTPTFFINGQLVAGALPMESFVELIEAELHK